MQSSTQPSVGHDDVHKSLDADTPPTVQHSTYPRVGQAGYHKPLDTYVAPAVQNPAVISYVHPTQSSVEQVNLSFQDTTSNLYNRTQIGQSSIQGVPPDKLEFHPSQFVAISTVSYNPLTGHQINIMVSNKTI